MQIHLIRVMLFLREGVLIADGVNTGTLHQMMSHVAKGPIKRQRASSALEPVMHRNLAEARVVFELLV